MTLLQKECSQNKLVIERYFCNELHHEERSLVEVHLGACKECTRYLQQLMQQRDSFIARYPFARFHSALNSKPRPWYVVLVKQLVYPGSLYKPLVVLGVILFVITPLWIFRSQDTEFMRTKGKQHLSFIYSRGGIIQPGSTEETFLPGDTIQFLYTSQKEQYLSISSITSDGELFWYHPDSSSRMSSIAISFGSGLSFPVSMNIDSKSGYELFVGVFSQKPLTKESIALWIRRNYKEASHDLDTLSDVLLKNPLRKQCIVETFLIKKEP